MEMKRMSSSAWSVGDKKPRRSVMGGDFVRKVAEEEDASWVGRLRAKATQATSSVYMANFMVTVVFADAYCTCRDIDARADGLSGPPRVFSVLSDLCLVLYTAELLMYIFINGIRILRDWMICMDVVIITCGYIELVFNWAGESEGVVGISIVRALRLVRIFRLIRLLRKIRTLRELHKLAMMMATCAKTLVWSFLLCFLVMTLWSMLMVETVHPLLQELQANSAFEDCKHCDQAMSSVMVANLLLFKTVIAGDSWGEIAVPVIEQYPATALIFMGSLLTLVFGVLNLIVAVVVDTFADARASDVQNLAEEMEDDIANDRKSLAKLFKRIDKDGSGQLTLEELIEGAERDADFQSRLRVMDIDEKDLQMLFDMIDTDKSGTIEAAEFIGPLSRWAHDSKTAPRFIKYNMLQTMQLQEDLYEMCSDCFKHLALQVDQVHLDIRGLVKHIVKKKGKEPVSVPTGVAPESRHTQSPCESEEAAQEIVPNTPRQSVLSTSAGSQSEKGNEDREEPKGMVVQEDLVANHRAPRRPPTIPELPALELQHELEHLMAMRPSRQTEMLSPEPKVSETTHLDLMLESAVLKLENSMKKMERLAHSADIMVRKWHEVPEHERRGGGGHSTSTSSRKSDVFWSLYMDREHVRERRAKKKQQALEGRTSVQSWNSYASKSGTRDLERLISGPDEAELADVTEESIGLSLASSIFDDPEEPERRV